MTPAPTRTSPAHHHSQPSGFDSALSPAVLAWASRRLSYVPIDLAQIALCMMSLGAVLGGGACFISKKGNFLRNVPKAPSHPRWFRVRGGVPLAESDHMTMTTLTHEDRHAFGLALLRHASSYVRKKIIHSSCCLFTSKLPLSSKSSYIDSVRVHIYFVCTTLSTKIHNQPIWPVYWWPFDNIM